MRHELVILLLGILLTLGSGNVTKERCLLFPDEANTIISDPCLVLYESLGLKDKIAYSVFEKAFNGYQKVEGRQKNILTLIDFTKPSSEERLFVVDMDQRRLLYHSVVAHGRNSGNLYATSFSNTPNSLQSSLGFYLTDDTYYGKNGYSLHLNGLEQGINDNARRRAIVMHGARYANPSVCQGGGRLGRSFGCPAVPEDINRPIIDTIKGGSVLFIYAEDPQYQAKSQYLTSAPLVTRTT